MMTDGEVLQLLNMSADNLRVMGESVEEALNDGRISPFEAVMLAAQGMNMGVALYSMFRANQDDITDIVRVLRQVEFRIKGA